MKNYIIFILAASVAVSCLRESETIGPNEKEMTFSAAYAEESTKTSRQTDGKLLWSPQEEINIFYGNRSQGRFVSTNTSSVNVAEFKGTIDISCGFTEEEKTDTPYWAVYPYSKDNECDGNTITLTHPNIQTSPEGSFGDKMFPSVSCSHSLSLPFYNICGGMKISVSRQDITSITLEGNNGEMLAGKIKVKFNKYWIPEATILEGQNKITLTPDGSTTFVKDSDYYITIVPVTLSAGFKITFRTSGGKKGVLSTTSPVTIKRNVFATKASIDSYVKIWEDEPVSPTYRSGVYIGINGFNQAVYSCPISLATSTNQSDFTNFINSLTAKNGTVLYYAVECSLDALQKTSFPPDLSNVAVVTFTDGLDQGSMMYNPTYSSDDEYLDAINTRLNNEKVSGVNLTAYSIGLKGSDVTDVTKFRKNLKKLATSDNNVFMVSSMSEVEERFKEIAKVSSASASTSYAYNMTFTVPGQANGTKIRFTFDNVSDAENSKLYIEGTFNFSTKCLESVKYEGFNAAIESIITGRTDGIFVNYDFKGISKPDGSELSLNDIKQWACEPSSSIWQVNSEFNNVTDVTANIDVSHKSSAVILILDCSSSLGAQFSTMQSSACSFVSTLISTSQDKYAVESVSLGKSLNVFLNYKFQLYPTITPSTAVDKSLRWTSSNTAIATVSSEGVVTGKKIGTCIITATASNGVSAQCEVIVIPMEEIVDLGLSVIWASCNLGATKPEEYGRYFAWGDVVGQTWDGSKWSGNGFSSDPSYEVDANNNLKPAYDAAHVLLGEFWRMPTHAEQEELINNCTVIWTTINGVNGKLLTSKKTGFSDRSIFFPTAGTGLGSNRGSADSFGAYWSSTINSSPYSLHIYQGGISTPVDESFKGFSVRPVFVF